MYLAIERKSLLSLALTIAGPKVGALGNAGGRAKQKQLPRHEAQQPIQQ